MVLTSKDILEELKKIQNERTWVPKYIYFRPVGDERLIELARECDIEIRYYGDDSRQI